MALNMHTRRLRLLVLASLFITVGATVAAYISRRQQVRQETPQPVPIAADVDQQTQAFSLSKTLADHTLYTIQAEQVTNFKDTGKALLRGVSILIYGKDGSRRDRITAAECEYDPAARSVQIPGEVQMQLGVPVPLSESRLNANGPASLPITILTSGLSFDQASGIAATDADVRFRSELGDGTSNGATYDPAAQNLVLRSQVEFFIRDAPSTDPNVASPTSLPEEATRVRAGALRVAREEGKIFLENAVEITKGTRQVQAARGEITLDAAFRAQQVRLEGDLLATDRAPAYFTEARAARGQIEFTERGNLRTLELEQAVQWTTQALGSGPVREGKAERVEFVFQDTGSTLTRVLAERDVRVVLRNSASPSSLADAAIRRDTRNLAAETQILTAQRAEMMLSPSGKTLQRVQMTSAPRLELLSSGTGADRRTVTGDAFDIRFDPQGEISEFAAQGNVRVVTDDAGPASRQRVTTSDSLSAAFSPSTGKVERIRQWGRFRYQDPDRQAQAHEADYTVREETIVLQGDPRVWNAQGRVEASRMRLGTQSGSLDAERNVSSTYLPKSSEGNSSTEPLHVVADRLEYRSAKDRAHYQGHARLWQGASFLIEADSLELRQKEGELLAQDGVYTVFRRPDQTPDNRRGASVPPVPATGSFVIRSNTLLYRHKDRQAHYSGAVRLENEAGKVSAGELDLFFSPSTATRPLDFSGGADQIERAVAQTNVRILQGHSVASGDRAEYDPARGELRLTGNLATVTDPERGTTQGAQLTYLLGDDSIRVEGRPGLPTETRWRVHP